LASLKPFNGAGEIMNIRNSFLSIAARQFSINKQKRRLSRPHGRIETRFCAALGFDTPPLGALSMQAAKRVRWLVLLLVMIFLLGGFLFSGKPAAAQTDIYYRFSPTAIYADGQDSTTLEVYTGGGNVASVTIKPEFGDQPVFQLFDDGTNGDRSANDGVYTLGGINATMFPEDVISVLQWDENGQNADLSTVWLSAEIAYASGQSDFISFIDLKLLSPQIVFPAEQVGNGLFATEYAFFIVDGAGETYSGSFPNISDYNGPAITKKFYSVFPDEFDFINFMVVRGDLGMKAHAGGLLTPAENIGLDSVDYTAEYGSQGRLMTMTYSGFGFLNHEIGHTWGAFVGVEQGISNGVHWSGSTDIAGVMSEGYESPEGLHFFRANGDGTYNASYFEEVFSPLELYLMGMVPADKVPDVHVLIDPNLSDLERVTAQRVDTYTIDDIMAAAGGGRQPAYPNAQKDFNLATIFLSDSAFSPAEFGWFSYQSQCYMAHTDCGEGNFYAATGGRGTVNTRLADWGIPNIQSAVPEEVATQPLQPTNTVETIQSEPTEQIVEAAPQPTPVPRPEFNFPICNGLVIPFVFASFGWGVRSKYR
jgi:hypothetical protein